MARFSKGQRVKATSGREGVITFVALPTTSLSNLTVGETGRHLSKGTRSGSTVMTNPRIRKSESWRRSRSSHGSLMWPKR